jgi:hypothetical protein
MNNMKEFIKSVTTTHNQVGAGGVAVYDLFNLNNVLTDLMQGNEKQLVQILNMEFKSVWNFWTDSSLVNVLGDVTLFTYLADGAVAEYVPASSTNQEMIEELMEGFCNSNDISIKIISKTVTFTPRAMTWNGSVFSLITSATVNANITKIAKAVTEFAQDPLLADNVNAGIAAIVHGANGKNPVSHKLIRGRYNLRDRPMRTFVRKSI